MCNNVWCVEVLREYKSSPFNKYSTCEMFVRIRCCVFLSWLMSLCCCNARPHETSRRCYGSQMVVACASCSWICSGTWCYPVATLFGINASQFICTSLTFIWFLEILSSWRTWSPSRSWNGFFLEGCWEQYLILRKYWKIIMHSTADIFSCIVVTLFVKGKRRTSVQRTWCCPVPHCYYQDEKKALRKRLVVDVVR